MAASAPHPRSSWPPSWQSRLPAAQRRRISRLGGAEANDPAYKIARLYWKRRGEPGRVNIVSRIRDYHGLTYGATSATGLANFWKGFEPLAPGFLHGPAPDPYRYAGEGSPGAAYARALEEVVLKG